MAKPRRYGDEEFAVLESSMLKLERGQYLFVVDAEFTPKQLFKLSNNQRILVITARENAGRQVFSCICLKEDHEGAVAAANKMVADMGGKNIQGSWVD